MGLRRAASGCLGLVWCIISGLLSFAGCTPSLQELEQTYGPHQPEMEAAYAAEAIRPRSEWRIYITGRDPDGDLRYIQTLVEVPWGQTITRLLVEPSRGAALSGFITLHSIRFLDFAPRWIRVRLRLEDKAGHRSQPVEFYTRFEAGAPPQAPPEGTFQERFLGRIPLEAIPDAIGPGI